MIRRLLLAIFVSTPVLAQEANPKVKEYEATLEILRVQTTKGMESIENVFDEESAKLKGKLLELLKQELDELLKTKDLDSSVQLRDGIKELEDYTPTLDEKRDTATRKFAHPLVRNFDSRIKLLRAQAVRAISRMESGFEDEARKLRDELADSLMEDVDAAMEAQDIDKAVASRDLAKKIQGSNPTLYSSGNSPLAVAPFGSDEAQRLQRLCAESLGVPVDVTNSIGMQLKLIPPGTFMMGSESGMAGEKPVHEVTLSYPFYMSVYEVTQSEYMRVMGKNPSKFRGPDNPVDSVTWDDAVAFCQRMSALAAEKAAGRIYRLPTEAEWEYACRAGTTTNYSFGNDLGLLQRYAQYYTPGGKLHHPVGQLLPNAFGVYDMHGNVWEWCQDFVAPYSKSPRTDPTGPSTGAERVLRGGGGRHTTIGNAYRSSARNGEAQSYHKVNLSLRVVTALPTN